MNYLCHSLVFTCAGCNHLATHTHKTKGVGRGITTVRRCGAAVRCRHTKGAGVHSAHMTGRNWGFLLQMAIFLPIETILHPHNIGQPGVCKG